MTHQPAAFDAAHAAAIIEARAGEAGALLPLLHDLQAAFGHVPDPVLPLVATALNLSRAEVEGVVSFYHDFRRTPPPTPIVRLCRAEACQARGSEALVALAAGRRDVTLEVVYCLGLCASGPAAMTGDRLVARLDAPSFVRLLDEAAR